MVDNCCAAPGCERSAVVTRDGHRVCKLHYQRLRTHGQFEKPKRKQIEWRTCTIDGCDKPSRTVGGKLCEMHYGRFYRVGNFDAPKRGRKSITDGGYVWMYEPLHPVAGKNGALYEHRAVLYNSIGPGEHACHWCSQPVEWSALGPRKLVVDHLDNNKLHNDASNLVPACHACNSTRGLFMSWVYKHKDDPFLLRLFNSANDNRSTPVVAA